MAREEPFQRFGKGRRQADGPLSVVFWELVRRYLWIAVGIVMYILGGTLLEQGGILKTQGVHSVVEQPTNTCQASVMSVSSDGKQITIDRGWCSSFTLKVPSDLGQIASSLDIGAPVWFISNQDGSLISLWKDKPLGTWPAGTCEGTIAARYAVGKIVLNPITPSQSKQSLSSCTRQLAVPDDLATMVKSLEAEDPVWFDTDGEGNLSVLVSKDCLVSFREAAGAVVLAFAVSWTLLLVVTRGHPWAFILGVDLRISNSQTQAYLWFIVLVSVYLAAFFLRLYHTSYFGGIGAPTDLLALAGISATSFVGARASNWVQTSTAPPGETKGTGAPNRSRWQLAQDLFTNDAGAYDLGDFQMIALTVAAIAIYIIISIDALTSLTYMHHVDLPQVDETLIGGTAVSQGAYLLKKFASRLGN